MKNIKLLAILTITLMLGGSLGCHKKGWPAKNMNTTISNPGTTGNGGDTFGGGGSGDPGDTGDNGNEDGTTNTGGSYVYLEGFAINGCFDGTIPTNNGITPFKFSIDNSNGEIFVYFAHGSVPYVVKEWFLTVRHIVSGELITVNYSDYSALPANFEVELIALSGLLAPLCDPHAFDCPIELSWERSGNKVVIYGQVGLDPNTPESIIAIECTPDSGVTPEWTGGCL